MSQEEFRTTPKYASTPLELLTNKPLIEPPLTSKYFGAAFFGSMAFACICAGNWYTKRPYFAGIQKHIIGTIGFAALGDFLSKYRDDYYAEKDAVLRHYVQLHPDEFPPFERRKFSEVLERWVPAR